MSSNCLGGVMMMIIMNMMVTMMMMTMAMMNKQAGKQQEEIADAKQALKDLREASAENQKRGAFSSKGLNQSDQSDQSNRSIGPIDQWTQSIESVRIAPLLLRCC